MSQIWCWSAGGQGWGPGAGASLLVAQSWVLTWQTAGLRCSWDWFPPTGLWGQNSGDRSFWLQATESRVATPCRKVGTQQDWSSNLAGSELSLCP